MDRKKLLNMIARVSDEVRRLKSDLTALQSSVLSENLDNYSDFSRQAAIRGEVVASKLRRLVYDSACTTKTPQAFYLETAAEALDIKVSSSSDGVVEITIPCLIPSRKRKSAGFITDPLYAALERFVSDRPPDQPFERFKHCVICIIHVYDKALLVKGRHRDHDNIEVGEIINVINTFLLTDDIGVLCDIYHTSKISDYDYTRIFIVKKDMFAEWILGYENRP